MSFRRSKRKRKPTGKAESNRSERSPSRYQAANSNESMNEFIENSYEDVLVHDEENLLERARTQWQFGDWQSLAGLNRDKLQHHPDRAKLALLAAAGCLQLGKDIEAKQFIRLAENWGINRRLISQILIAGVHNSLGRAAAVGGLEQQALQHFETAISIGGVGGTTKLLAKARIIEKISQIGGTNVR